MQSGMYLQMQLTTWHHWPEVCHAVTMRAMTPKLGTRQFAMIEKGFTSVSHLAANLGI